MTVAMLLGVVADAAASATIAGQVTEAVTNNPIDQAVIQFYQFEAGVFVATTTTNAMGFYTSPTLAPGTYALLTQDKHGHINQITKNISETFECSTACDTNVVTGISVSTTNITNLNFVLRTGGRVSGRVTDSGTTNGVDNVTVYFADAAGDMIFSQATTSGGGFYTMEGGSDTGNVYAFTDNALGYRNEVYNNHYCQDCDPTTGDAIAVTINVPKNAIDFALDPGGRITGTVTNTIPAPLAGVHVHIYDSTGNNVNDLLTDGTGAYSSAGLPTGTYYVATRNAPGYVDELYNDKLCPRGYCDPTQGNAVMVTAPTTTQNINFALAPGGTLTGIVTAASGGAPLHDIFVAIFNLAGNFIGGASTDNSGVYYTTLPTGTYYAAVTGATGWANQLYNNMACAGFCNITSGTQIGVTAGNTTGTINFALVAGGTLSGTVTDASNMNAPINLLSVQLFSSSGSLLLSTDTDSMGHYSFSGLSAASYYVRTVSFGQYINQLYNSGGNVTCIFCTVTSSGGSLVPVTAGGTANNINFALTVGGRISGTIRNAADMSLLNGITAVIFTSGGTQLGSAFATNMSGVYTTSGLPPGAYYVVTRNTVGFINKLYNDKPCTIGCTATSGDAVTIVGTSPTNGIDFQLVAGGRISGKVTDAGTTAGISNASILFYNSGGSLIGSLNTDFSGNFTTGGVPGGTYYARVQVNNPIYYVGQAYNGKPCIQGACIPIMTTTDPISVSVGVITQNINFPLALGGRFSGTLTNDATGAPLLSNVSVHIFNTGGTEIGSGFTDGAGNYTMGGAIPVGTYYAYASNSLGLLNRLYNNKPCGTSCTPTTGTPISVTAGVTTPGVNFKMVPVFTYTDLTLTPQVTLIKAAHLNELRTYINQLRHQLGLAPFTFTDTLTAGVTQVKVLHVTELRTALDAVYDALGLAHYSYTDPVLTAGTMIKQVHIAQIRSAIQAVQ